MQNQLYESLKQNNVSPYECCLVNYNPVKYFGIKNMSPAELSELERLESDDGFKSMQLLLQKSIEEGEIFNIDSSIDYILEHTNPPTDILHLPYPRFFINRYFLFGDIFVPGIGVVKMPNEDSTHFFYVIMTKGTYTPIFNKIEGTTFSGKKDWNSWEGDDEIHSDAKKIDKYLTEYLQKLISLLNTNNDDIKFINRKPSKKKTTPSSPQYNPTIRPTTQISVFGETKRYIDEFKKATKKSKKQSSTFIVRGHYRTFRHPRYKSKQGETIWIAPYVKGMKKELLHKFVNIKF